MSFLPKLKISDYNYPLPEEKIAVYPLEKRDHSKLLVYNSSNKDKTIISSTFYKIQEFLPKDALLVLNNTKVFPARLHFKTEAGQTIEIFLINPTGQNPYIWETLVGNRKKFKEDMILSIPFFFKEKEFHLFAKWQNRDKNHVEFYSDINEEDLHFYEILEHIGKIPLPPYIKRDASEIDKERYQTVFAENTGAVAAPTASLHFTEDLLSEIEHNFALEYLTLHVSAGTFKPVSVDFVNDHEMHAERFVFRTDLVERILSNKFVIPVGTTSMRMLESLHFIGAKLLLKEENCFDILSEDGFNPEYKQFTLQQSLTAILSHCKDSKKQEISGNTSIFIMPGFEFRVCKGIITNFHQPSSTLLLLIAALVGDDWKTIYNFALANNFRFLSYGDSSLLFKREVT